jgi:hypothetical protein
LRTMDLYKAIVLLSIVLLPVGGYLIKSQNEEIAACQKAIADATRPGGTLEEIGKLQRKVQVVVQNKRSMSDAIKDPSGYFQSQILAAGGSGLRTNDFQPLPPKTEAGAGSRVQKTSDHVVEVKWTREDMVVPMDFVYAVLFNCESGASASAEQVQQSVWKLRELTLENATEMRSLQAYKTPPLELADKWIIKNMKFARREPVKGV